MSTVWKVIVALALVLPIGAFVAGSLVSSSADEPADRDPVILRETPQETSSKPEPVRKQEKQQEREEPVVIAPEPASTTDADDDDGDDGDDDDEGDDDGDDD